MIIIKIFKIKIRLSSKKDSVCVFFFSFNILKKRKKGGFRYEERLRKFKTGESVL